MPTIEIIKLKAEHLDRLIRFFAEINCPEYKDNFSPHPFDAQQAKLICNYQGRDLYYSILLDGEEIIGYGMLRGWDEGYEIPSIGLCILNKYQNLGLGIFFLQFLEVVSKLINCNKIMLKVKKCNVVAKELYKGKGYCFKDYNKTFLVGYKEIRKEED